MDEEESRLTEPVKKAADGDGSYGVPAKELRFWANRQNSELYSIIANHPSGFWNGEL